MDIASIAANIPDEGLGKSVGYEVPLEDDGSGYNIDPEGHHAPIEWEIKCVTQEGRDMIGGYPTSFDEMQELIASVIEAMRMNKIHGFTVAPVWPEEQED